MSPGAAALLVQAEAMLATPNGAGGAHTPRLAAFLARQALEELIGQHCRDAGVETARANTASQLIVLRVLAEPDTADAAAVAWHGLSNACHHHAYELSPTVGEVQHLCQMVASMLHAGPN